MVLTDNQDFLRNPAVMQEADPLPDAKAPVLWTDNYSALLPLLRF